MDANDVSADYVIAELVDMGFEFPVTLDAIKTVGPCLDDAIEFILQGSFGSSTPRHSVANDRHLSLYDCSTSQESVLGKRTASSCTQGRTKQSSITEHIKSLGRVKKSHSASTFDAHTSSFKGSELGVKGGYSDSVHMNHNVEPVSELNQQKLHNYKPVKQEVSLEDNDSSSFANLHDDKTMSGWEEKVKSLLWKHFGFSSLKAFQREALEAWLEHRDCLVLAATGSGKSLCFQIPALLTGKVVVVISPLISLMHDQCLKLGRHGVSACFLGSGQPESSIERKAMNGMYGVIYVCPETILRLIKPLQRLAENRGIALFAIDEVHCISKWGHDFRPDYRRLAVLRENFKATNLEFLKHDIPLMALTATATKHVREDILKSLCMSKETKIVLTSFFRPNLRFSVKHSRTSCRSSYNQDFSELINAYTSKRMASARKSDNTGLDMESDPESSSGSANSGSSISDPDEIYSIDSEKFDCDQIAENGGEMGSVNEIPPVPERNQLSVEYLENELDCCDSVDDLDVSCGEFDGHSLPENQDLDMPSETLNPSMNLVKRKDLQEPLGQGPSIIYVPTRKETLKISQYLCKFGVKAAAYHAKLPKTYLRRIHEEFHRNMVEVVVATIAFGMGIDKSNVRRIIHYGWPQSLEAYYQEAGRAGRDGKLADCTLYADLSRIPTLLPSQRSEEQTKHAYKMLQDCFRYGMATTTCRAKILVNYFGEEFKHDKCLMCDVCVTSSPELRNMSVEAVAFMRVLAAQHGSSSEQCLDDDAIYNKVRRGRFFEKPDLRLVVCKIKEEFQQFTASDQLWWRGFARILEEKGYVRESDGMIRVSIKFPELTELGLRFIDSKFEQSFFAYPEADMILSAQRCNQPFSSFAESGRGWANREIRRLHLQKFKCGRKKRKILSIEKDRDARTVRGRLASKLLKQKH